MLRNYLILLLNCFLIVNSNTFDTPVEDFCNGKYTIVSDLSQEDCGDDFYKPDYNRCFPGCLSLEEINEKPNDCQVNRCPPGFYCPPPPDDPFADNVCVVNETSCFKYYTKFNDNEYFKLKTPDCLENGDWAPKQCKGEPANGRCFCYNAIGNRIFGQEFSQKAENMTCACSRRRDEIEKSRSSSYVTLHCDSMGNYEPLQCDSGICWCVEPKTGKVISTTVPEQAMTMLPCYSKEDIGDMYLRQCESQKYAQIKIANKLNTHGTLYANFDSVFCDADGSYGSYKIDRGELYCTWRDNSVIGSWHITLSGSLSDVNCNCARDTQLFSLQGLKMTLKCSQNGNYEPLQQTNDGKYYCVDSDGFPISDECNNKIDCTKEVITCED